MLGFGLLDALPALSDLSCLAFAIWTVPALWRVLTSRSVGYWDPLCAVALLLISGRYGFTLTRWIGGSHPEMYSHGEMLGRQGAFAWSIATLVVAAYVIRSYRMMTK